MVSGDPRADGVFLTLEGGEGVGKSTLSTWLAEKLEQQGHRSIQTREPGGSTLAEHARKLVLTPPEGQQWAPLAQALLMNAARVDHLETLIRPALARGEWVICDRFSDSTLAYQSVGDGLSLEVLRTFEQPVIGDTRPDLTILLDAAPEDVQHRRVSRGGPADVFEQQSLDFHQAVRACFLEIARESPNRFLIVDALQTTEAIGSDVLDALKQRGLL